MLLRERFFLINLLTLFEVIFLIPKGERAFNIYKYE